MNLTDMLKRLEPIVKIMGVAVGEVWKIFVQRYVVKGMRLVFAGIISAIIAYALHKILFPISPIFILVIIVPIIFGSVMIFMAIPYLFNPRYFALQDLAKQIRENRDIIG